MKIVQIDHKAAKKDCEYHLTAYPNEKNAVYNLRRSYLDLAAQLEAAKRMGEAYLQSQIDLYSVRKELEAARKDAERMMYVFDQLFENTGPAETKLERTRKAIDAAMRVDNEQKEA